MFLRNRVFGLGSESGLPGLVVEIVVSNVHSIYLLAVLPDALADTAFASRFNSSATYSSVRGVSSIVARWWSWNEKQNLKLWMSQSTFACDVDQSRSRIPENAGCFCAQLRNV